MLKTFITISILLFSLVTFSQAKKDTVGYRATFTVQEFGAVLNSIDANIDSKKSAKEIIDFILKHSQPIEAEKPKPTK